MGNSCCFNEVIYDEIVITNKNLSKNLSKSIQFANARKKVFKNELENIENFDYLTKSLEYNKPQNTNGSKINNTNFSKLCNSNQELNIIHFENDYQMMNTIIDSKDLVKLNNNDENEIDIDQVNKIILFPKQPKMKGKTRTRNSKDIFDKNKGKIISSYDINNRLMKTYAEENVNTSIKTKTGESTRENFTDRVVMNNY